MESIYFKDDDEIVSKLKEIGILTKTKTSKDLEELKYKVKINNEILSFKCRVLAFNRKKTNKNCINSYYENLTIRANDETFNINIDYFKDMQRKSFGYEDDSLE